MSTAFVFRFTQMLKLETYIDYKGVIVPLFENTTVPSEYLRLVGVATAAYRTATNTPLPMRRFGYHDAKYVKFVAEKASILLSQGRYQGMELVERFFPREEDQSCDAYTFLRAHLPLFSSTDPQDPAQFSMTEYAPYTYHDPYEGFPALLYYPVLVNYLKRRGKQTDTLVRYITRIRQTSFAFTYVSFADLLRRGFEDMALTHVQNIPTSEELEALEGNAFLRRAFAMRLTPYTPFLVEKTMRELIPQISSPILTQEHVHGIVSYTKAEYRKNPSSLFAVVCVLRMLCAGDRLWGQDLPRYTTDCLLCGEPSSIYAQCGHGQVCASCLPEASNWLTQKKCAQCRTFTPFFYEV